MLILSGMPALVSALRCVTGVIVNAQILLTSLTHKTLFNDDVDQLLRLLVSVK